MPMKSLSFLTSLSLLALTFPFAIASDPNPVQDFCVGVNTPANGVLVNGKFCKDPTLATADDFYFTGLNQRGETKNPFGFNVTFGNVDNVPGLNTLGLSFARADIGVNGQVPPHYHPRASEILGVSEGTLLVGFVTSDQRLFTKTLNVGDVFVFPQGLTHFAANVGQVQAVAFAALNSQNPGTIFIADNVFGSNPPITPSLLAKAFQLNITTIMELQAKF
uniref:Germin-like protein n=2 Tax=Noccaea caerulescens TaxID=107243 RepID=A0A1J3D0P5_NOCCA